MHDRRKSDGPVVPAKPSNNAGRSAAEVVEGRGPAKGNATSETRPGRRAGLSVSNDLDRVRQAARKDKDARFTALLHHVTVDRLEAAYRAIRPGAAPGVDGVTWKDYGQDLEANVRDLHARVHRGAYRARPSRGTYIPKPDGRRRPLGIAALEDKVLQRAVAEVPNAIYECDFLGFSYGFRPGRSQHDALDALAVAITKRRVNWILDADIRDCFSKLDHSWLEKFLEHRIADRRVLRLIQKWLRAGVVEDGAWTACDEGTPQGASISTLLSNVYLHYVFDLWVHQWRGRHARGEMIVVRFADDAVAGFEHRDDAERFLADLRERFAEFNLELAEEKTRLIEFGRFAARNRKNRGFPKPETFDFLGFTHACGKTRKTGRFALKRVTSKERLRAKLREVKTELMQRRHDPIPDQGRWLASVVRGHSNYYAARQHRRGRSLPQPGGPALATRATAPQPAHPPDVGTHETARPLLATH
jgi:RNA-directed DNA polymerase